MEDKIFELLKSVIDPELNVNIVDLGLVYDIKVDGSNIEVVMTLSTKGCPLGDSIMESVEYTVKKSYPDFQIKVNLVWEPQWNPSYISDQGKQMLGY